MRKTVAANIFSQVAYSLLFNRIEILKWGTEVFSKIMIRNKYQKI